MTKKSSKRGLGLVEMALTLSLLLLLTFALLEYGWLFLKQNQTARAARRGARIAILPFATNDKVLTAIAAVMGKAGMGESGYTVTLSPEDVTLAHPFDIVRVELSVPYQNVALTGGSLVPVPTRLYASVSMAREGP